MTAKTELRASWVEASCGEAYATDASPRAQLEAQARARYEMEPFIARFARFAEGAGKRVLEIGVGIDARAVPPDRRAQGRSIVTSRLTSGMWGGA